MMVSHTADVHSGEERFELMDRLVHGFIRHMDTAIHGGLDASVAQEFLQIPRYARRK